MFKIVVAILIVGAFFLQKVGTHGALLKSPYDRIYKIFNDIFSFIHTPLRRNIKPINIGRGLDLDIVPFITLSILVLILLLISSTRITYLTH